MGEATGLATAGDGVIADAAVGQSICVAGAMPGSTVTFGIRDGAALPSGSGGRKIPLKYSKMSSSQRSLSFVNLPRTDHTTLGYKA